MACTLCGREQEDGQAQSHWIGCARGAEPDLSDEEAYERGLLYKEPEPVPQAVEMELLKEGSMTTVPVDGDWHEDEFQPDEDESPEDGDNQPGLCEYPGCTNRKYNTHGRTKFCEFHKNPKNRKE